MQNEATIDKLSRMADPARNDNPHERAVANTKLDLLRFKLYGMQPEYKYGWRDEIKDWWIESCGNIKDCWMESRDGVIGIFFWVGLIGILALANPHQSDSSPEPPTTEERIRAERLDKIDTAMEALQNERDQIDPPQDDDRDEHSYW